MANISSSAARPANMSMMLILSSLLLLSSFAYVAVPSQVAHKPTFWKAAKTSLAAASSISPSSPAVLCIGDALLDCIANDDARGWSVDDMMASEKWTAFPGGAPANVACSLSKLGTSSAFCGCLGNDDDGSQLEALLNECGVNVSLLQHTSELPTRRVMVTRSLEGDREFGGFYQGRRADEFADCLLDAKEIFESDQADVVLDSVQWMVCSTLSLAFEKSAEALGALVDRGLQQGVQLYVDVNWRPVFFQDELAAHKEICALVQLANVVKLTDEEAEWLLGIPAAEALEDPGRVHEAFPKAQAVLVTAGELGSSYSVGNGVVGRLESFNIPVVETTGAGDAFTAGFLHGLLSSGEGIESLSPDMASDLIRFATAVGALTCTREGAIAAQPTFQEVESFLIHV